MKVHITRAIHEAGMHLLQQAHEVQVHGEAPLSEAELVSFVADADALVTLLTDPVTEGVFAAGSQLKVVAQYAVGYDNIDLAAAKRHNVIVTNTPGQLSGQAVAEHTVALLLTLCRSIVPADRFVREGKYHQWEPNLFLGRELHGKTLGIIGTGQIGSVVATVCHLGLGMKVIYQDVHPNAELERSLGALLVTKEELLQQADVVSLHVPLLPATHHLIDAAALELMKPTAFLLNTARGPVVDEIALLTALRSKRIAGAAMDVYENEPELAAGLTDLENVVLTPHIASATEEARKAMGESVARNVLAVLAGQPPLSPVELKA